MPIPHLTKDLIARLERFNAEFHAARMGAAAAVSGNPFGIQVRRFGEDVVAVKVRSPLLRGKNRSGGITPETLDVLPELIDFYRSENLPFSLSIPYGRMTREMFDRLTAAGMRSAGSGAAPVLAPAGETFPEDGSGIVVRPSPLEERELYLDLFQRAFGHRAGESAPEYRAFQWAEDSLPGGARYIAEIDGTPVGMASFPIVQGVGFFGTAGVLPEYRGRGVQTALIRRRIRDAPGLGCDLVVGGGSMGETTYRNFERAGLRLIPTGMNWAG